MIAQLISSVLVFACSTQGNTLVFGPNEKCDANLYGCSTSSQHVCCSPDNGKMVLALSWMETKGPADKWTIHGLWPNKCDGTNTPAGGCDLNRAYSSDQIDNHLARSPGLKDRLNAAWISNGNSNLNFWRDEFRKHGTCLSTYHYDCNPGNGPGDDAIRYFKKTLDLYDSADLYKVLENQQIVPGANYTRQQFTNAAKKTPYKFRLICDEHNKLEEIYISYKVKGVDAFEFDHTGLGGRCQDPIMYPAKILPEEPSTDDETPSPTNIGPNNRRVGTPVNSGSYSTFVSSTNGHQPAGPVVGRQPAGPVNGRQPAGRVNGRQPAGPVNGLQPAGPVVGSQPAGPVVGRQPAGPVNGRQPAGPVVGRQPAGPVNGRQPAGPVVGRQPAGPVNGRQPAGPVVGRQPDGSVVGRQPVSAGPAGGQSSGGRGSSGNSGNSARRPKN